jgi:hypothetical protein
VVYKYVLDAEELLRTASMHQGLEAEVLEYDHKSKQMVSKLKVPGGNEGVKLG